jgi:putative flippase GtrA
MSAFVTRLTQRRGVRQFVKFGIVGASGFVVNLACFTVLQRLVPSSIISGSAYNAIFSASFLAGGVSNYVLNRIWTFRSDAHPGREGAKFMTVSVIALGVGLLVGQIVAPYLGHGHRTWFVQTVCGIVVNFFINKYWTFRNT